MSIFRYVVITTGGGDASGWIMGEERYALGQSLVTTYCNKALNLIMKAIDNSLQ